MRYTCCAVHHGKLVTILLLISVICLGSAAILWPQPSQLSHGTLKNTSATTNSSESIGQEMRESQNAIGTREPAPATILSMQAQALTEIRISTLEGSTDTLVGTLTREGPDAWMLALPAPKTASADDDEDTAATDTQSPLAQTNPALVRWPVAQRRMHAFLRILASLQGMPLDAAPEPWSPAARLDLLGQIGPDHTPVRSTITLDGKSLGGRAAVQVRDDIPSQAEQTYLSNDQLLRLFANPSLTQWLDARPFAGLEGGAEGMGNANSSSRGREKILSLRVQSGPRAMTLSRVGVRWMITEPYHARAQSEVVSQTIRDLLSLSMENPVPTTTHTPPPVTSSQGLAQTTTITLTTQRRTPDADGSVHTELTRHTLTTLGAADESGALAIIAQVQPEESQTAALGPIAGSVDARTLLGAVHSARVYLDRITLLATQGDVQAISIDLGTGSPLAWARTTSNTPSAPTTSSNPANPKPPAAHWLAIDPDTIGSNPPKPFTATKKQASSPSAAQPAPLDALLTLLTHEQAALCVWVGKDTLGPADMQPVATIECFGLGGLSIGSAVLGMAPLPNTSQAPGQPSQSYAVLVRDGVARYYDPRETIGIVRWLVSLKPEKSPVSP